jgi:methionyl-tRNA synthetase
MISFEDFEKLDLQVGTIREVEDITDANKLILLTVSLAEQKRQVVAGIKNEVEDLENLIDQQVVMVTNLEPKEMFGHESQGMILAARGDDGAVLVSPQQSVEDGTIVS